MDLKWIGTLSVFALAGVILLAVVFIAAETLSALRSYSSLQTHWTESRKEAVNNLEQYIYSGRQEHFNEFRENMATLKNAELARLELISSQPHRQKIMELLEPFRFNDSEVKNMISTYKRVGFLREFKQAVSLWKASSEGINQLEQLGGEISHYDTDQAAFNDNTNSLISDVEELDAELTELQYELASVLSRGTDRLQSLILWSTISVGLILFLTGGIMAVRFMRSLHRWKRALTLSKERYQSLFGHNPNAVYSFNLKGEFVEGNKALYKLVGMDPEEVKGTTFDRFIQPSERDKVRNYFHKAARGEPQTYETVGVDKQGDKLYVQITNMPIYAGGEIVGVYGIAQDISARIKAEQRFQQQLQERTVLLEEIHHRVKNNLALISGLLMLQEDTVDSEEVRFKLRESQNRIFSLADVHEIIYNTEDFSRLPIPTYAESIISRICNSFAGKQQINYAISKEDVFLEINEAIPFGLIINELTTNSCKHAFSEQEKGTVRLDISKDNSRVIVTYQDNGKGLPEDFCFEDAAQNSLGMQLVDNLLQQLNADFNLHTGRNGFRLDFEFKSQNTS